MLNNFIKLKSEQRRGFTLIEIMIATSIMLLVTVIGSNFIIYGFRWSTFQAEQETAVYTARRAIEILTKEIRGANTSEQGDYPLKIIEKDNFEYYSDVEYDGEMERIRYYLDGLILKKVVTQPGPSDDYSLPGATTTIAEFVNNQEEPIFIYYDSGGAETNDIDSIRLVRIVLKINVTPERAPNDYYVETDVHLRNLKSNL